MKKTVQQLYEDYRDDMARLIALQDVAPEKFQNIEFLEHYGRKVERIETLIALCADLLHAQRRER